MPSKKRGHGAAALPARFVKRSITIRPEVDSALREIAGDGEYSQVVNEALLLFIQARGIDAILADDEATHGPIPSEVMADVDRRLDEAHRRAERRAKARR